ncbi:MAG: SHOCT domain-containing protein [Acidimicrobiia bacterium]|nr:SHOCT domain-containing protein [Acidimicrobiia bacterium]
MTLGELLLAIFWFFLLVIWIYLLITIFVDIFRSDDLSGWAKALWILFIIILPLLGVLVYVIARGEGMQERRAQDAADAQKAQDDYIREVAGSDSSADELAKLADLRDRGVITQDEFDAQKAKILS